MADDVKVLLVCSHYEAGPGEVFVEVYDEDCGQLWEKRAATDVGDATIITCARCDKAAVQLDHLWPYHQEMCLCAVHLAVWREEQVAALAERRCETCRHCKQWTTSDGEPRAACTRLSDAHRVIEFVVPERDGCSRWQDREAADA